VGAQVLVNNRYKAVIKFVGETQFKPGVWYGVELERARGKHNGTVSVRRGAARRATVLRISPRRRCDALLCPRPARRRCLA
jgi:CAP-Gly domain-containing linker protein 3/4